MDKLNLVDRQQFNQAMQRLRVISAHLGRYYNGYSGDRLPKTPNNYQQEILKELKDIEKLFAMSVMPRAK